MLTIALFVALQAPVQAPPTPPAQPAPSEAAPSEPAPAPATTPAAPPPLPPPQKPRLLVMDLVDKGAGAEATGAINQAVQGQAVQSHLGETVTATQVKIALDAAANQAMVGCESESCMTDIGKTVEAAIILGGSVAKVGEDYLITLLAVNARDGSRLSQVQRKTPANRELYYYAAKQLTSLALTGRSVDPRVPVVLKVSDGSSAMFIVDGKESGEGPQVTVQLDPGSHEIRIRQSGKAEWKTVLSVEEATPQQVTADLVDSRVELWPAAVATGAGTAVVAAAGLFVGLIAEDVYSGTIDLPLYETRPETSYLQPEPVDSVTLFARQKDVELSSLTANILFASAAVLGVATVGLVTADLVLGAAAE